MQKQIKTIPKRAMELLANAVWPGNIRELENFIERAVILTQGTELSLPLADLRKSIGQSSALGSKFRDIERNMIIEAPQGGLWQDCPVTDEQQSGWV